MSIHEYFAEQLGVEPDEPTLWECPLDSPCGRSCKQVVDAANQPCGPTAMLAFTQASGSLVKGLNQPGNSDAACCQLLRCPGAQAGVHRPAAHGRAEPLGLAASHARLEAPAAPGTARRSGLSRR
jgi:hypothetical protein